MFPQFKSVLRRPLRTMLLVLLLGAVTFGFTTRGVEYLVVTRAVDELSEYYKAIGSLSSSDGDVTQGARLLSESDLVAINDVQRTCSGTLNGTYNNCLCGALGGYCLYRYAFLPQQPGGVYGYSRSRRNREVHGGRTPR